MDEFIARHRGQIDSFILGKYGKLISAASLDDATRRHWIYNEENLRGWAIRQGVTIPGVHHCSLCNSYH